MFRKWLNAGSISLDSKLRQRDLNRQPHQFGQFEQLEDKRCLAFVAFFNPVTMTLDLTQTFDNGNITIDNNGGANAFRATDLSGTVTYLAATNLEVNLLDGTTNQLDLDLDNAHAGDVELNLGDGARSVNFTGTGNAIGGSLTVTAGTDNQTIEVAVANTLSVGGNASFDLGVGFDQVDNDLNDISILGDMNFVGVNEFDNDGTLSVGGNVSVDSSGETETTRFDDDNSMLIVGDLTFTGGDGRDVVLLNDAGITTVGGNVFIDLADNTVGLDQLAWFDSADTTITGNVTVLSTNSATMDVYQTVVGATINGEISIDFGDGVNQADMFGTFGGTNVDYVGGSGVDTVSYDMSGSLADVLVTLGAGDDIFTLGANASIAPTTLTVDFGDNNDTFTNNFGAFTFDAMLLGLLGFDYTYDSTTDSLTADEVSNAGAVEFDNNGTANAWRFNNGVVELTPSTNLSVTMLGGTGSTLDIDLDNPLAGNLTIDLGNGARALNFISAVSNTIDGDLTVTAGSDAQNIEVAVNNDLTVSGFALFDLGTGFDTVDEDGNNVTIVGNLDLIGVNEFENNGTMIIGGNVSVDSSFETETTRFDDDSVLTIGGTFTFTGGDGRDEVLLNDAGVTSVGGDVFIDLADNTAGGTQFARFNSSDTILNGNLTVLSTNSATLDDYQDIAGATIVGDIFVQLGGGPNEADFLGTIGFASNVKYNGGSGVDTVTYDMSGGPADVNIKLSTDSDPFTLGPNASISPTTLRVDFGGGLNDTFTNNYGGFDFDARLLNWEGYSRFFYLASSEWNLVQVLDTGDITIDNNGAGNAIRLLDGAITEMTAADTVRLNLLDGTSTNVTVDLDSPLAGDLIVQLLGGARNVMLTGSSNTVGGLLRIEAADGIQSVDLAVNSDLTVGANLVVNGRDGVDVVDDGANNITVAGDMFLRGINLFENTNTLTVGGGLNMVTVLESDDARLDNDGIMNIAGALTYVGGDGVDDILLNSGGVTIGGVLSITLGTASDITNAQNVSLAGGFTSSGLAITGSDSIGANELITDHATNITGNVFVNFESSSTINRALFFGSYNGTNIGYRGGSGNDFVLRGAAAAAGTDFAAMLNADTDTFTLEATALLQSVFVDFGTGNDIFVDNLGMPYPFPVTLINLP